MIKDTLDKNVEFVRASDYGAVSDGIVKWTITNVPAGEEGNVTLTVKVKESALASKNGPGKVVNGGETATVKVGNDNEFTLDVVENPVTDEPKEDEPKKDEPKKDEPKKDEPSTPSTTPNESTPSTPAKPNESTPSTPATPAKPATPVSTGDTVPVGMIAVIMCLAACGIGVVAFQIKKRKGSDK